MAAKLMLSIEENVIKRAKAYAKNSGRSLSELIENYLQALTAEPSDSKQLSPKLKKLVGVVKLPSDFDEKQALHDYLREKQL